MIKEYFIDVLTKHYADFKGTATRKQYWLFILWCLVLSVILIAVTFVAGQVGRILTLLLSVALIMPHVSIFVRRVKDTGNSAYWGVLMIPWVLTVLCGFLPQSTAEVPLVRILLSLLGFASLLCFIGVLIFSLMPSKNR